MEELYFTPKQVAKILHIHEQTARKWIREKIIEGFPINASASPNGRRLRVSIHALETYFQQRGQTMHPELLKVS